MIIVIICSVILFGVSVWRMWAASKEWSNSFYFWVILFFVTLITSVMGIAGLLTSCPECGHYFAKDADRYFCGSCGYDLGNAPRYCLSCDQKGKTEYCVTCGKKTIIYENSLEKND